jgi:hypothetical protein
MNVPAPQWTAIAFSESTLHSGGSNGQATQGAAEDIAKSNCRSAGATDCNVLISRSNQCLALAVSDADDVWGYAGDDNRDQAAEEASTECRGVKANSCMVQAAQCASDNPVYPPRHWRCRTVPVSIRLWAAFNGSKDRRSLFCPTTRRLAGLSCQVGWQ